MAIITKTYSITSGGDDGYRSISPSFISTSVLKFGNDYGQSYNVWLRFNNIDIPKNTILVTAKLIFKVSNSSIASNVLINISANNTVNPIAPTTPEEYDDLTLSGTKGINFNDAWIAGETYISEDISSVVQGMINNQDWQSGKSLQLLLKDTASNSAYRFPRSYENTPSDAAQLIIEYETGENISIIAPLSNSNANILVPQISATKNININTPILISTSNILYPTFNNLTTINTTINAILLQANSGLLTPSFYNLSQGFIVERQIDSGGWHILTYLNEDIREYDDYDVIVGSVEYRVTKFIDLLSEMSNVAILSGLISYLYSNGFSLPIYGTPSSTRPLVISTPIGQGALELVELVSSEASPFRISTSSGIKSIKKVIV